MDDTSAPYVFAQQAFERIAPPRLIALIHSTQDNPFIPIAGFLHGGTDRHERALFIRSDMSEKQVREGLGKAGLKPGKKTERNAVDVRDVRDVFFTDGSFDAEAALHWISKEADKTRAGKYSGLRIAWDMAWAAADATLFDTITRFKILLLKQADSLGVSCLCVCNRDVFSSDRLRQIIFTHPFIFYHDTLCENFYHVPMEEYLASDTGGLETQRLLQNLLVRQRTEQELRESEEKYRSLVDLAVDGILIIQDDNVVYANPHLLAMIGHTLPEVIGTHFLDYVDPAFVKDVTNYYRRRIAGKPSPATYEVVLHRKDGSRMPTEIRAGLIEYAGQKAVLVIIRDITERLATEARLRQLSRAVQQSPVSILITDPDGSIEYANPKFLSLTGYTESEVLGANPRILKSGHHSKEFYKDLWDTITDGRQWKGEFHNRKKNGDLYWEQATISPIFGADGTITNFVGIKEDITERKEADRILKESEERYRLLVDLSPEAIMIHSEGKVAFVNRAAMNLVGAERPEEMVGRPILDFVHPDYREKVVERLKAMNERDSFADLTEEKLLRLDGSVIIGEVAATKFRDGDTMSVLVMVRDVTERRKAEEAHRASEARFRHIFEASNEAIYVIKDQRFVLINPKFEELLGYSAEEVCRTDFNFLDLIASESRNLIIERAHLRDEGKDVENRYTFRARAKSGRMLDFEASLSDIEWEGGPAVLGILRNITEHKRAEEALRASEQRNRAILSALPDLMFIIGRDGTYLDYRAPSEDLLALPPSEILGKNLKEAGFSEEKLKEVLDAIDTSLATGTIRTVEYSLTVPRGIGHFEARLVPYGRDEVLTLVRDITEKHNLEEQLQQAQKMEAIGRLAGGVAHDFNNLLTGIIGHAELAQLQLDKKDPLYRDLEDILSTSERATELIQQLLAFGRKQVIEPRILDMNQILEKMERMLRRVIGEDIELDLMLADNLGMVRADQGQIEQVIVNLVVNARDAMPDGGTLTIETGNVELSAEYTRIERDLEPGRYVLFAVSDTGHGIPDEIKAQIFEPFFTTKPEGKGTGLGLATVYGIIRQSGGKISVYSEPEHGSTFKVYLPVEDEKRPEVVSKSLYASDPSGDETVLVVEDEESVRETAVRTLKRFGYNVLEAQSGGDAFLLCKKLKNQVDLVLTDVVMPAMSGHELANQLKEFWPDVRILYMSGYTENAIVHHGILQRGVNYIQKPFRPLALAQKVREVIDQ